MDNAYINHIRETGAIYSTGKSICENYVSKGEMKPVDFHNDLVLYENDGPDIRCEIRRGDEVMAEGWRGFIYWHLWKYLIKEKGYVYKGDVKKLMKP